jgi:hypothetical protein
MRPLPHPPSFITGRPRRPVRPVRVAAQPDGADRAPLQADGQHARGAPDRARLPRPPRAGAPAAGLHRRHLQAGRVELQLRAGEWPRRPAPRPGRRRRRGARAAPPPAHPTNPPATTQALFCSLPLLLSPLAGDQGLDGPGPEGALHHARPQVGHPRAAARLPRQGLLRLVRRAHRLRLHHRRLLRGRLEGVVAAGGARRGAGAARGGARGRRRRRRRGGPGPGAAPSRGGAGAVHGQGQRALPHRHLPRLPAGHGARVDDDALHLGHRVPQLRGRQVQQEPGRG